jgi:hemerythrin-like domain-containing protein
VSAAASALGLLLEPHTAAEEVGLFAVLAEDAEFTDHVQALCEEHVTLEALLDRVARGEHEVFVTFERALRVHIDREENGLFPAAAVRFAGPEWGRVTALTPDAGSIARA